MVTAAKAAERKSRKKSRSRAREMRRGPGYTERIFWAELRDRKLDGFKFKRQHPISRYIADFVCLERKLIVELDGGIHKLKAKNDLIRDAALKARGYRVVRLKNEDVLADLPGALLIILHALGPATPSPQPSPPLKRGRGRIEDERLMTSITSHIQPSPGVKTSPS